MPKWQIVLHSFFFKLASINAFFFYTDNIPPNLKVNDVAVLMQHTG